jgi:hypothetical protein
MVDRNVPEAAVGYRAILAIDENGDVGEVICNPSPMGEANACLIAAAPDLLACLMDVLDADGDLYAMDFDRYRVAIAKATGGAP